MTLINLFQDYNDTSKLTQIAINLWTGWGYNMFKVENQLRADSMVIRTKGSQILGRAKTSLSDAETAYRRKMLPPLTRESPKHHPDALAGARSIEALVTEIGRIEGQLRSAPAPETDRIMLRWRNERGLLERLVESDKITIGKAEVFRSVVEGKDGQWVVENEAQIRAGLASLDESIKERSDMLLTV